MLRPGIAFCLASCLALATTVADPRLRGLQNFYKVDEHVYRGGQPTAEGFRSLASLGVKTVIDLRGAEHSEGGEKRLVEADGMRYVSIPMKNRKSPTDEQISAALALMNDSAAWPVFVHCKRGENRTGTVVACYRVGHDHWNADKALSEARSYGMKWYQTALKRYVRNYKARFGH